MRGLCSGRAGGELGGGAEFRGGIVYHAASPRAEWFAFRKGKSWAGLISDGGFGEVSLLCDA